MNAIYTEKTATHRNYNWECLAPDKRWKCGDIEARRLDCGRIFYFVKVAGSWRKAWPKTRPYGYSHISDLKVGFNQIGKFFHN